jgi:hypothetical protein
VLVPCVDPKFVPAIVTAVPTDPDVGLTLLIAGPTMVTPPEAQLISKNDSGIAITDKLLWPKCFRTMTVTSEHARGYC